MDGVLMDNNGMVVPTVLHADLSTGGGDKNMGVAYNYVKQQPVTARGFQPDPFGGVAFLPGWNVGLGFRGLKKIIYTNTSGAFQVLFFSGNAYMKRGGTGVMPRFIQAAADALNGGAPALVVENATAAQEEFNIFLAKGIAVRPHKIRIQMNFVGAGEALSGNGFTVCWVDETLNPARVASNTWDSYQTAQDFQKDQIEIKWATDVNPNGAGLGFSCDTAVLIGVPNGVRFNMQLDF